MSPFLQTDSGIIAMLEAIRFDAVFGLALPHSCPHKLQI